MRIGEIPNSRQSLLILTSAVIELIHAANTLHSDQSPSAEMNLLTYHRAKQIQLLEQLHDVILLRTNALSSSKDQDMTGIESSIEKSLMELLASCGTDCPSQDQYISLITQLQKKCTKSPAEELDIEIPVGAPIGGSVEEQLIIHEIKNSIANPSLTWTNHTPTSRNGAKTKKKKQDNTFQIKIGTTIYNGIL